MTNKETLRQKIEETKAKIRANSKDAHFADTLISELITAQSQLKGDCIFPNIAYGEIEDKYDGGSYVIETFRDGSVMYHTIGGFTIIGDYRIAGMNAVLRDFIKKLSGETPIADDMRELIELDLSANTYVLNIPMFAFSDVNLKFELATKVVEYLNEMYKEAINAELPDDDPEANKLFYDAVVGSGNSEEIKDFVKKD